LALPIVIRLLLGMLPTSISTLNVLGASKCFAGMVNLLSKALLLIGPDSPEPFHSQAHGLRIATHTQSPRDTRACPHHPTAL
jgi:hypothetical protein